MKKKIEKRKKFLFILLMSAVQMSGFLIKNIFSSKIHQDLRKNISNFSLALYLVILSLIFLRFSIYIHQSFSFGIILLCSVIFITETVIYGDIDFSDVITSFLYFSLYEIFLCLVDVLGKKYLNTYMDGIYLFLFKIGITQLSVFLLYDLITFSIDMNEDYQGIIKYIIKKNMYLDILPDIASSIIFDIGLWLTIYYFSPCHFIIINVILDIIETLTVIIKTDKFKIGQIITFCILYPVLIFAVLVFNEVIILKFCGLNYNTEKYILEREKKEAETEDSRLSLNSLGNDEVDDDKKF